MLLTWELSWKTYLVWEKILNSENEILVTLFKKRKWETEIGKAIKSVIRNFGNDVSSAKELKSNIDLYVEAIAVLK